MTIEQIDSLNRIKLLMGYNTKNTLSENYKKILLREAPPSKGDTQLSDDDKVLQLIRVIPRTDIGESTSTDSVIVPMGGYTIVEYYFKNNSGNNLYVYNVTSPKISSSISAQVIKIEELDTEKSLNLPFTVPKDKVIKVSILFQDEKNVTEDYASNLFNELNSSGEWNDKLYDGTENTMFAGKTISEGNEIGIEIQTEKSRNDNTGIARGLSWPITNVNYSQSSLDVYNAIDSVKNRKSVSTILPNGKKSPGGYKVPEGYSPFVYDVFLYELFNFFKLSAKNFGLESIGGEPNPCVKYWNDLVPDDVKDSILGQNSSFLRSAWEDVKDIFKWTPDECEESVQKILDSYYNEKFPQGTVPELTDRFNLEYDSINKEISNFENTHSTTETRKSKEGGYYTEFDEDKLSPEDKIKYRNLLEKKLSIEEVYGYDARGDFDKFMDSPWGIGFQLLAMVLLSSIGGEIAAGEIGWGLVAELMFNTSMSLYYAERGKTFDAFLWFCFSFMGKLHNLYELIWAGMGNTAKIVISGGKGSIPKIAQSISQKLAASGIEIKSWQDYLAFRSTLTLEEQVVLNQFMRQDANTIVNSIKALGENYGTLKNAYKQIPKLKFAKAGPSLTRGSIKVVSDLYLISKLHEGYNNLVSYFKSKGYNIDFGTGEKREHFLKALESAGVTEISLNQFLANLKNLETKLNEVDYNLYLGMTKKLIDDLSQSSDEDFISWENTESVELPWTPDTESKRDSLVNNMNNLSTNLQQVADSVKTIRSQVEDRINIKITSPDSIPPQARQEFINLWNKAHPDRPKK